MEIKASQQTSSWKSRNIDLPSFGGTVQPDHCRSSRETPCSNWTRCCLSCSWVSTSNCSTACWETARVYVSLLIILLHCILFRLEHYWRQIWPHKITQCIQFKNNVMTLCTNQMYRTCCGDTEIKYLICSSSSSCSHKTVCSALHGLLTCGLNRQRGREYTAEIFISSVGLFILLFTGLLAHHVSQDCQAARKAL